MLGIEFRVRVHQVCAWAFEDGFLIEQSRAPRITRCTTSKPYPCAREVESCMKSFAPMIPRTIRTKSGNRCRVGSCTTVGAES